MLERIISLKTSEKYPWKMFFIGIVYASLSLLLVHWFFRNDASLSEASGMIVVLFCIMFSLPYMYFIIRREEKEDETIEGFFGVWKAHKDAIYALMLLFIGFIVAFSFWNVILQDSNLLNFQIQTYCQINNPSNLDNCISEYSFRELENSIGTGAATKEMRLFAIIENNIYVMIFTLLFSIIFGAGAIFILVWNASVIAAAVGIFAKYQLSELPLGIARYMIHGFPEIAAYFITALAGGIFGVGILRHGIKNKKTIRIIENSILLLFISLIILFFAGIIEVYVTPLMFG
jgi:uncharacterized membrane protein SpoIIM required for sporulation